MSIRIGLGLAGFPFSGPAAFLEWIDAIEEGGADSVWLSERLLAASTSLEPVAALAVIAGRTRRLKFGMNAIVLPLRDPLVLAAECATLDFLSGGRLLPVFGVGGENAPEFRGTGRSPAGRGARSDEMLRIMRRLWTGERVTFEGRHFSYRDVSINPLPVQQPLPCWIGGSSPAAIRRTALLGTGWLAGVQSPDQVRPVVAAIRAAAAEAGTVIDDDHYGAGFAFRFGTWDEPAVQRTAAAYERIPGAAPPRDLLAVGDAATITARIREYVRAGISKFVARPVATGDADVMDQTRRLIAEVLPGVGVLDHPAT